jgi:hypothetical protein
MAMATNSLEPQPEGGSSRSTAALPLPGDRQRATNWHTRGSGFRPSAQAAPSVREARQAAKPESVGRLQSPGAAPHFLVVRARLCHAGWGTQRARPLAPSTQWLLCKRLLPKPIACGFTPLRLLHIRPCDPSLLPELRQHFERSGLGCTCTLTMTSSRLPSCHARILFPNHGPPFFHACLADDAITRPGQSRYEVPRIALFKPI